MPIYTLNEHCPIVDPSVFIAPNATIIGKVKIEKNTSVWFNTVIRGDEDWISIGPNSNIQDLSMLHTDPSIPLSIGKSVTIGHRCIIHGCTIEDYCLIGMGAIIMNGAVIGKGSLVAAGAVVLENTVIPEKSLVTGIPGKIKRSFDQDMIEVNQLPALVYQELSEKYKDPAQFNLKD